MRAKTLSPLVTLVALAMVAAAVALAAAGPAGRGLGRAPGGQAERLEQGITTDLRLDALRDARTAGTFGGVQAISGAAAPGWSGEQLMNARTDDWEPAVAADPLSSFV